MLIVGQRINLTIFDFGIWSRHKNSVSNSVYCDKYAVISEHLIGQETSICAGDERIRSVYLSTTSSVDVMLRLNHQSMKDKHFLLKYEGKVSISY